ncbi:hypothetical protein Tco_1580732 [Tanacetum coccineum]
MRIKRVACARKSKIHHGTITTKKQDVSKDDLCPPHKQYDLMDANKKIDLVNPQCPNESKILGDILNNHPLQLSLAGSASVPWIYTQKFWHTLKLDDSKDKFKFFLDTKEFTFLVDDLRRIFQFPQATDNNNVGFVVAPSFSQMLHFSWMILVFLYQCDFPHTSCQKDSLNHGRHV